jgi:hypothetical protein
MFDRTYYKMIPARTLDALDAWGQEGCSGGGFLRAVLINDLFGAVDRADRDNSAVLVHICEYVYSQLPAGCWGSQEKYARWPDILKAAKTSKTEVCLKS